MRAVFADTGYWIARLNPRDQLHGRAVAIASELKSARMITSEMILVELLNGTCDERYLRTMVAQTVGGIRQTVSMTVVAQTAKQFAGALRLYEKAADKEWSLTDCASFLIMEEMGIRDALTHDQHFVQAGFRALLR